MTLGPISARQVAKNPLAHLYFPGSKPFFRFNSGSKEGANDGPAGAGTLLTSNATGSQIYAWYTEKLKSLGWTFVTDNGCRDIEASCPQYGHDGHGNREVFYLAVTNPALVVDAFGTSAPAACTVYDMAYEVFPPGGTRRVSEASRLEWRRLLLVDRDQVERSAWYTRIPDRSLRSQGIAKERLSLRRIS